MRYSSTTLPRWSAALVAACTIAPIFAASLGCAPDKGPGTLVVTYELGNSKTCAELGIDSVRAELYTGSFDEDATPAYSEDIPCTDGGEIVIEEITPDIYSTRVLAYDDAGVAVLDNFGQPEVERIVELFEAAETSLASELTARPAQVSVRWRLGPDGFSSCEGVGITSLEFTAYQNGTTVLLEHTFDCEEAGDADGYRKVPDPERLLIADVLDEVGIRPLDAAGDLTGTAATYMFDTPNLAGYPVPLTIECLDTGCSPTQ